MLDLPGNKQTTLRSAHYKYYAHVRQEFSSEQSGHAFYSQISIKLMKHQENDVIVKYGNGSQ
jgi:hypothetical protein